LESIQFAKYRVKDYTDRIDKEDTMDTLVSVVMGSRSDWQTMKYVSETLAGMSVSHAVHMRSHQFCWGAPRINGELQLLGIGIRISQRRCGKSGLFRQPCSWNLSSLSVSESIPSAAAEIVE
jgi:hypothetical protein